MIGGLSCARLVRKDLLVALHFIFTVFYYSDCVLKRTMNNVIFRCFVSFRSLQLSRITGTAVDPHQTCEPAIQTQHIDQISVLDVRWRWLRYCDESRIRTALSQQFFFLFLFETVGIPLGKTARMRLPSRQRNQRQRPPRTYM